MPEPGSRRFIVGQEAVSRASGSGQRWRSRLTGERAQARDVPISSLDETQKAALGYSRFPPLSRTGREGEALVLRRYNSRRLP